MLIAVLEKHAGLRLADQDVYASVLGGLKIGEPAADLPTALAIAGAFYDRALPSTAVAIGEIALSGEVRAVRQLEQRVQASVRRGARLLLVPASQEKLAKVASTVDIVPIRHVRQALDHLA
jgi:DNA repair protein RadA/Sms